MKQLPVLFSLALSGALVAAAANPADDAQNILKETGVQGGLVVHLGCGDGKLTAALHANESFLVHGLDADARNVEAAREHIQSLGLYGPVSVEQWSSQRLPYADNLANLIVTGDPGRVTSEELLRVLAPDGVALDTRHSPPVTLRKPWPKAMDDWTHYFYNASGNAVSKDTFVGPPRSLRWVAPPLWPRSHEYTPSLSALVSSGGRLFYIQEEGLIGSTDLRLPDRWALIARDGFNGTLLWKLPFSHWGGQEWNNHGHWGTPMSLTRRLVADGDRLYVTLGYRAPLSVVDASTGRIIRECPETQNTDEIICADGILVVRRRREISSYPTGASAWNVQVRQPGPKVPKEWTQLPPASAGDETIVALKTGTGEVLWKHSEPRIVLLTLAAAGGRVCFHTLAEIVCLDLKSGRQLWRAPSVSWPDLTGTSGTLLLYHDVVLYAAERGIEAWSAVDGRPLWKGPRSLTISSRHPADLFVADGLVWGSMSREMAAVDRLMPIVESPIVAPPMSGLAALGFDPMSGEVRRKIDVGHLVSEGHHVRCYRSKATERYLLWPKRGVEFVDISGANNHARCDWTRGECSYGLMPANGLLYNPPHPCVCYSGVELTGFRALSAQPAGSPRVSDAARLVRGPAFQQLSALNPQPSTSDDWPTYRHDPARSGATKTAVPLELSPAWSASLGGKLTSPVVADGRVIVAAVDAHTVHALKEQDGSPLWSFTADGRVDSAPTVHAGMVLFGSHDGWTYCLRAADGALVWRFQAAPAEHRIVSFQQVESSWPVPGSVLVQGGVAYFAAGRSSYLDGGIFVYGLDPSTGRVMHQAHLDGPHPDVLNEPGEGYWMDGAKSDLLVSDGSSLYMTLNRFDLKLNQLPSPVLERAGNRECSLHLMATGGFLDDTWSDRFYWIYGRQWPGHLFTVKGPKAGNILVFDESTTYVLYAFPLRGGLSPKPDPAHNGYDLYADSNDSEPGKAKGWFYAPGPPKKWSTKVPVRARGMVLAGTTLFLAGPPDVIPDDDPYAAFEGRKGAKLWAVSAADGSKLVEYSLKSMPVFDGMIAANKRLFISGADGQLLCLAAK